MRSQAVPRSAAVRRLSGTEAYVRDGVLFCVLIWSPASTMPSLPSWFWSWPTMVLTALPGVSRVMSASVFLSFPTSRTTAGPRRP